MTAHEWRSKPCSHPSLSAPWLNRITTELRPSLSHYSTENMKHVLRWFSCLLAEEAGGAGSSLLPELMSMFLRGGSTAGQPALCSRFFIFTIMENTKTASFTIFFHINTAGAFWHGAGTLHLADSLWQKWNCSHYTPTYCNQHDYSLLSSSFTFTRRVRRPEKPHADASHL